MKVRSAKILTPAPSQSAFRTASAALEEMDSHCTVLKKAQKPAAGEKVLWVRTVAGPAIGFGHLRRTLTLARMLRSSVTPLFLLDSDDRGSQEQVQRDQFGHQMFKPGKSWPDHASPSAILIDTRKEQGLTAADGGSPPPGGPGCEHPRPWAHAPGIGSRYRRQHSSFCRRFLSRGDELLRGAFLPGSGSGLRILSPASQTDPAESWQDHHQSRRRRLPALFPKGPGRTAMDRFEPGCCGRPGIRPLGAGGTRAGMLASIAVPVGRPGRVDCRAGVARRSRDHSRRAGCL